MIRGFVRTPQQLLKDWERATPENPLMLKAEECESFVKAMRLGKPIGERKLTIQDRDILLRDGVKSQADGNVYSNRRTYNDHLKRHDMVEVGDQAPTEARKEIVGDFECGKELHEAFKRHVG